MKWIFTILFSTISPAVIIAQQEAQFTQYMLTPLLYNPATAGAADNISFSGIARQQWVGTKTENGTNVNPRTYVFMVDAPARFVHGGLGFSIFQDQLGFDKNMGINFDYAYHLNLGPGNLKIGLQAVFLNTKRDFSKFEVLDDNDPVFMNKTIQSTMITDFGAGIHYSIPEKFWIGVSSSQLTEAKGSMEGSASLQLKRHYYITSGYNQSLGASKGWAIQPSVFIESDQAAYQFSASCLLVNPTYWAGLSYRYQDAVSILLGLEYHGLRWGYAYDWTVSDMKKNGSMGSHEIYLNYRIKINVTPPKTIYKNARYL
jgi:type IX secretion system PorP/SprF family membrane protein